MAYSIVEETTTIDFETLLQLFPDADTEFLMLMYDEIKYDEYMTENFITRAIKKGDYPKKRETLEKRAKEALHRKYKEDFRIEQFLEIIPDPVTYFTKGHHQPNKVERAYSIEYLKMRYTFINIAQISLCYEKNNNNLTATCYELDQCTVELQDEQQDFPSPRRCNATEQILQEIAFIENEWKIRAFLREKLLMKKLTFEKAKSKGELLECQCCCDDEILAEDVATCPTGHIFCKNCIIKFVEVMIGQGRTKFPCLTDCGEEFSLSTLERVLRSEVFSKLLQQKQIEEIQAAGIKGLETCPFCSFAAILAKGERVFHCQNKDCMLDSCRICKRHSHVPLRCNEVESSVQMKMRTYIENKMSEALIRTCLQCKRRFIKENGCNRMICSCGAQMCYICRKPVNDYTHFNGQGGTEYHKCALFSDIKELHDLPVLKEGTLAKKKVLREHPDTELKHDPTMPLKKKVTKQR